MIHHFNQRVTADAKMYHTWLYVTAPVIAIRDFHGQNRAEKS